MTLTIGSLFSGIGGLELGLEWAGLGPVVFQCELDPYCRAVLAKHWPNVVRFEDVTRPRDWPHVDLVCGGFPCQDVSSAGKRRGLGGERSGLWYHFARVVQQIRPRFVVVENVRSGSTKWLRPVRHQLHLFGYRTRALGIAASDCGAPHRRARVFVVAYAECDGVREQSWRRSGPRGTDATIVGCNGSTRPVAYADSQGQRNFAEHAEVACASADAADADSARRSRAGTNSHEGRLGPIANSWWKSEPAVGRLADGVSGGLAGRNRRAALRALGNAVVPQVAQVVGEVIREMLSQ